MNVLTQDLRPGMVLSNGDVIRGVATGSTVMVRFTNGRTVEVPTGESVWIEWSAPLA